MLSRVCTILMVSGPAVVSCSMQQLQLDSDVLPDDGQMTSQGCRCKSSCAPRAEDKFNCDGCSTDETCSASGGWDYCVYPQDDDFERQEYTAKMDDWWGKITGSSGAPSSFPNPAGMLQASMQTSFDNEKDEMPAGRIKWVHTRGSICKFELKISEQSKYTGLLGSGQQEGLIRLGSAFDGDLDVFGGVTPGLGLKFARSGVRSGNVVTLHTAVPGGSWKFFDRNQSNMIAPTDPPNPLTFKFRQSTQCTNQVGLSDLARYSQDGTKHEPPSFPFKLFLVPSTDVQQKMNQKQPTGAPGQSLDAVHTAIENLDAGTTLYSVYACDEPSYNEMTPTTSLEEACGSPSKLGDLVTTSFCTSSKYGDEKFHVRHQRIEEDWALRPDFLEKYNATATCGPAAGQTVSPDTAPDTCAAARPSQSHLVPVSPHV